ncbi:MAG: M23 family metallopeptidase [Anaerolineales bacterium]|nr:M23 family metallopeptidase [Anaerolineales bacterium]
MTKIYVVPHSLLASSKDMLGTGANVDAAGDRLLAVAKGAPSYEGQFGPWVQGLAAEARGKSKLYSTEVSGLGLRVGRKGEQFAAVDQGSVLGASHIAYGVGPFRQGTLLWWLATLRYGTLFEALQRLYPWLFIPRFLIPVIAMHLHGFRRHSKNFNPQVQEPSPKDVGQIAGGTSVAGFNPAYRNWRLSEKGGGFADPNYKPFGHYALHNGMDLKPSDGDTTIYPIGPGKVRGVYQDKGLGNYIVVEHQLSDGTFIESTYGHMANKPTLSEGDIVTYDTKLGDMGSSGAVTGAHLHLTINKKGQQGLWTYLQTLGDARPSDPVPGINPPKTYEAQMKEVWIDPTPYVNGKSNFEFLETDKW